MPRKLSPEDIDFMAHMIKGLYGRISDEDASEGMVVKQDQFGRAIGPKRDDDHYVMLLIPKSKIPEDLMVLEYT